MKGYFLRRLILIPLTLVGVTLLVFTITRLVPGGAMERALQQAARGADTSGKRGAAGEAQGGLSDDQLEVLEEHYGLDKPILHAYAQWLGILPRENQISKGEFHPTEDEGRVGSGGSGENETQIVLQGDGRLVNVSRNEAGELTGVFADTFESITDEGWSMRYETTADRQARYKRRNPGVAVLPDYVPRAVAFKTGFSGVLQGDLGRSQIYGERVVDMVMERVPIAAYFGILTAIITYGVCLPLGVLKALRHRTMLDSTTSVLVFIGYSIPGFALGAMLLVYLGARLNLVPLAGFTSPDFSELSMVGKVKDLAWHTWLPLLCYVVGGFATLTMLTKNNLMDNLAADYVRTAVAKGSGYYRAVFGHAFRNSMIPVVTSLGDLITVFVGGSMLIERVFDIQGFGLLGYHAVIDRDIFVIMGTLTISAGLMLLGNVLSDLLVAWVDPRIKFE